MTRTNVFLLLCAAALAVSACAPATPPPPAVVPQGEDRFLADPRTGYEAAVDPALDTRFEHAWRYLLAGDEAEAARRLTQIQQQNPDYLPALLAEAALHIRAGRLQEAREIVARVQQRDPDYVAARVYEAEIALREQRARDAYEIYRDIAPIPGAPPTAAERAAQLQEAMFNETFAAARNATGPEAIRLLREALTLNPSATEPRILLARRLVEQREFDSARSELDPLLDTVPDDPEVQELLAEIDAGRGRYQEAIVRYERLARRTDDPRYAQRLEEIKREWNAANMPPHVRSAIDAEPLTRAELATLLYWLVPSVRFAQNLPTPPIAIDVAQVEARDEVIRAIAIGLYDVDRITRRVHPHRQVTVSRFTSHLERLLMLRGAACARGVTQDEVLAACGIANPLDALPPDATLTGRQAVPYIEQVARKF